MKNVIFLLGILAVLAVAMTAGCIHEDKIITDSGPELGGNNQTGLAGLSNFERHASISKIGDVTKNNIYYSFDPDTFATIEKFTAAAGQLAEEEYASKLQPYPVTKIEFTTTIGGTEYKLISTPNDGLTLNGKRV